MNDPEKAKIPPPAGTPEWDLDAEMAAYASDDRTDGSFISDTGIDLTDPTLVLASDGSVKGSSEVLTPEDLLNSFHRYDDFKDIGSGGVGQVKCASDPHLGRRIAMKRLHPRYKNNRDHRTRFVREARVMAQLEHPNVMPVHELGVDTDGCVYFTMKRVHGVTLREILNGLIREEEEFVERYTRGNLLDIFGHICQAISFAHSRGVIHRDLKPENIMVGDFGEVLVLDWGLAKLMGQSDGAQDNADRIDDSQSDLGASLDLEIGTTTLEGEVSGTPLYMAPEQARGKQSQIDAQTDLYSLGIIFYELLTYARPIKGRTIKEILKAVVNGEIVSPRRAAKDMRIPRELDAICMKAIAVNKADRYSSVRELLAELHRYHEGRPVKAFHEPFWISFGKYCRRHAGLSSTIGAAATVLVLAAAAFILMRYASYRSMVTEAEQHRVAGSRLYEQKVAKVMDLQAMQQERRFKEVPAAEKALQEEVEELHNRSENHYDIAMVFYNNAIQLWPASKKVYEGTNQIVGNQLRYAILTNDYPRLRELLRFIRTFRGENFEKVEPRARSDLLLFDQIANGDGSLTLQSDPTGAEVIIWRLQPDEKGILTPQAPRKSGLTPIQSAPLKKGSYLAVLQLANRPAVKVPVKIDHAEHDKINIRIPKNIPRGFSYIPAGYFYLGGIHARFLKLQEKELPAYFIRNTETTVGEYIEFWRAADGGNRDPELIPHIRFSRANRNFTKAWDAETETFIEPVKEYSPVVGISGTTAVQYCRWLSAKLGRTVRLPTAAEWEKAARGVDGRKYVWGDVYRTSFAYTDDNREKKELLRFWAPPKSFPADRSIYGVYDMAGNVREYTASRFPHDSPFYQIKGASFATTRRFLYCAYASDTAVVPSDVGFRYVMEVENDDF